MHSLIEICEVFQGIGFATIFAYSVSSDRKFREIFLELTGIGAVAVIINYGILQDTVLINIATSYAAVLLLAFIALLWERDHRTAKTQTAGNTAKQK